MGRHSAPDDDGEDAGGTVVAPPASAPSRGRHARSDAENGSVESPPAGPEVDLRKPQPTPAGTETTGVIEKVPEAADGQAPEAPAPVARGNQSTAADLALLRSRPDVRARVIAAVVVPFVLYTLVLLLIGSTHVYLLWIWIPLVSAGVLAGSILDAAHRRPPPAG